MESPSARRAGARRCEYVIFSPEGPRLLTVAAAAGRSIGDTAGRMVTSAEMSQDPELPALAVLGFALGCEELMPVHRDSPARTSRL